MLDLKEAYFILGLDENASDEQLEERYSLLLIKGRNQKEVDFVPMEDIIRAYNFIRDSKLQAHASKLEPKNKTVGKISHIWEYYRWHFFSSIAIVLLVFFTTSSILDNRAESRRIAAADMKLAFFVDYYMQDDLAASFHNTLLEVMDHWEDVYVIAQYAPTEPVDDYDIAMLQRSTLIMAAESHDIYILDPENFMKFAFQEPFINLEQIPELAAIPEEYRVYGNIEAANNIWFGIDITHSSVIDELPIPEEKIAAIRSDATRLENAIELLLWLIEN